MFNFFKKEIEFICVDPNVSKIYPIIPSSDYKFEWKKKLSDSSKTVNRFVEHKFFHLCQGINLLHSSGWILLNSRDVYIKTHEDNTIEWRVNYSGDGDYIGFHIKENFKFMNHWPSNANETVLKFNTGWFAKIPKNYTLLQIPLIFQDDDRFTTIPGMYSSNLGLAALNVPVFWNRTYEDETIIKAGTPLAQFILIKNENFKHKITNDREKISLFRYLSFHQFRPNYKKISDKIKEHA